ncbi:hypothetical protein BDN71DRAFT_1448401 [Pleurotus eryngii]|uniref:CBM1 domain-containing protein n=1 Tax=Pleurotus eryngii TaxID=5323 RepID=A0A9P5ZY54_PLEER|nr:hypothetical protein BDN71DRAFT_1448401 [Pleurotus eryngii]
MKSAFVLAAVCSLVYAIPAPTAYPDDGAAAPGLPEGAQCGGIEHTGPTECAPGLICHGFNDWLVFYCVKPSPRPTTTRTPTPTRSCSVAIETTTKQPPAPSPNGLPLGAQCGGIDYSGPTQCATGLICHGFNDWLYYECIQPREPIPTTPITRTHTYTYCS